MSIVRIKRSAIHGNPDFLAVGELAYSWADSTQPSLATTGDRLYIGTGTESGNPVNASTHAVIGGVYFTNMMDHDRGLLAASSAILVDSNKKIDYLLTTNIKIGGATGDGLDNVIGTTNTDGNLVLNPNGTGKVKIANTWTLPRDKGSDKNILQIDTAGDATWFDGSIYIGSTNISLGNGTGTIQSIAGFKKLSGGTSEGNYLSVESETVLADVRGGIVSIKAGTGGTVSKTWAFNDDGTTDFPEYTFPAADGTTGYYLQTDGEGVLSWAEIAGTFFIGSTEVTIGNASLDVTSIDGLSSIFVGNLKVSDSTIEGYNSTLTNIGITLKPKGTGHVSVNDALLRDVADPLLATDAANKRYVDGVAQGLHAHQAVEVATPNILITLSGGSAVYYNGPDNDGYSATITLGTALTTIDNHALASGNRILVKNEGDLNGLGSFANGIYTIDATFKILTRANDFETISEIAGGDFVFVVNGTVYNDTGWVQTEKILALGSENPILFNQFAGAGTYIAGAGLDLTGKTFSINVSATGGLEIVSDDLQLKSTVAGNGLEYDNGVISVKVTTNRTAITLGAIDISENYVGQASINTLSEYDEGTSSGGILNATWRADTIESTYGGTGHTEYATFDLLVGDITDGSGALSKLSKLAMGGAGKVLQVNSDGNALIYDYLDGGTY